MNKSDKPKKVVGVPFKKGQSGNPNGRPVGTISLKTRVRRLLESCEDIPEALSMAMAANLGKQKGAVIDAILVSQTIRAMDENNAGSTKAAEVLMDRGYGKEKDVLDITEGESVDDQDKEILKRYYEEREKGE